MALMVTLSAVCQAGALSVSLDGSYYVSAGCGSDTQTVRTQQDYTQNVIGFSSSDSTSGSSAVNPDGSCGGEPRYAAAGYSFNVLNNYTTGNAYDVDNPEGYADGSAGFELIYNDEITFQPGTYEMTLTMTENPGGYCPDMTAEFAIEFAKQMNYLYEPCAGIPPPPAAPQT